MSVQTETLTTSAIQSAMDETYHQLKGVLSVISDPLSSTPDEGGWTVRQLLSHISGSWQRVPVHAGYMLNGGATVPIVAENDFWIPEWENAPLKSFELSIDAGYSGCKALIATLSNDDLEIKRETTFGEMSLGNLLMLSFGGHLGHSHVPQLAAFTDQ